jgi:hypothetical protein
LLVTLKFDKFLEAFKQLWPIRFWDGSERPRIRLACILGDWMYGSGAGKKKNNHK